MEADCDTLATGESALVTGQVPDRYERAVELLRGGETVIAPADPASIERLDEYPAVSNVVPAVDGDSRALSDVGVGISRRVDELAGPDVLVDLTRLEADRIDSSLAQFRFVLLVRYRVAAAGGRLVCTLDEAADPVVRATCAELVDSCHWAGSGHDWRTVGELSP